MSLALVSLVGLILFLWPFAGSGLPPDAPALAVALASFGALAIMELGARRLDSGRLALLAVLAALNAGLRMALVTGIGGWSPMFFLVMLAGYSFGASYGFLVGAFSLLVSALVTGGLGPWVPYEAFALGWVGVASGAASWAVRRLERGGEDGRDRSGPGPIRLPRREPWLPRRRDLAALAVVAVATGFAYGALTDVFGWVTFYRGLDGIGWLPGAAPAESLARFVRYYLLTSLGWDAFRAIGDTIAVLALGSPVLMALGRLRTRLGFEIVETPA